jgi:hypothetical protein
VQNGPDTTMLKSSTRIPSNGPINASGKRSPSIADRIPQPSDAYSSSHSDATTSDPSEALSPSARTF